MRQPLPGRKTVRLATGDYVSGTYLITIVTNERRWSLGRIKSGVMHHSPLGALVASQIDALPSTRPRIGIEEHIVMPNHVHMVIWLAHGREVHEIVEGTLEDNSVGSVVGGFKSGVTRTAREQGLVALDKPVWQRGFHEAVLRTEQSVVDACRYVERNPELWDWDPVRGG